MVEVKAIRFGDSFKYKGLINCKELYKIIDSWLKQNGYDKIEIWNFEEIYEDGKQITLKLQPYKKISDYAKIEIRLNMVLSKMKDVVVTKDKVKIKVQKGEGSFKFDVFLTTDYEGSWESKPLYYFLKTIAEKFLYRGLIDRYEDIAHKDADALKREIKSFLNMERFRN
ncbi:hypothetical protein K9L67_01500 [Candidatus Woesearchaeota archaeon]|nr:hypothetical protein [Candidatus Woesearchaeota archaeon]MCF8013894.1 hypothetical protein [Candidatus Woesearchaeota archaeon]